VDYTQALAVGSKKVNVNSRRKEISTDYTERTETAAHERSETTILLPI
jgi:hypothetical protein